jgi:beta-lactamase class D
LETGVVVDAGTSFTHDGKVHSQQAANRDRKLHSAFAKSIVWYYLEIARKTGPQPYERCLADWQYGNGDISGRLTNFWLGNALKISAVEQIDFLHRLQAGELSVSDRARGILLDLMIFSDDTIGTLRGNPGTTQKTAGGDDDLVWFVGW